MECVEAERALKSSYFGEIAMKSSYPQNFSEDFWGFAAGVNGVLPADDFSVDEFFDLPSEDFKDGSFNMEEEEEEEEDDEEEEERDVSSVSLSSQDPIDDGHSNSTGFSGVAVSGSLSGEDLSIPVVDMAELELWSHFMDDSISEVSLACPAVNGLSKTGIYAENGSEPESKTTVFRTPCIPASFPVKPRSKRPRSNHQGWWLRNPLKSESLTLSSPAAAGLMLAYPVQDMDSLYYGFAKPAPKKQKKKPGAEDGGSQGQVRRCTHCQVQKTPQWRTGPLGPKTLCNACGVRFKSGRLFPEYRPACSPTFSSEIHSNSHRKVLEIRRQKELVEPEAPTMTSC